jgi:hypothetical protein
MVKKLIREEAGKGRLILLARLIPVGTPPERVDVLVSAVKQFGSYPITARLDSVTLEILSKPLFEGWVKREGFMIEV